MGFCKQAHVHFMNVKRERERRRRCCCRCRRQRWWRERGIARIERSVCVCVCRPLSQRALALRGRETRLCRRTPRPTAGMAARTPSPALRGARQARSSAATGASPWNAAPAVRSRAACAADASGASRRRHGRASMHCALAIKKKVH